MTNWDLNHGPLPHCQLPGPGESQTGRRDKLSCQMKLSVEMTKLAWLFLLLPQSKNSWSPLKPNVRN